MRRRSIRSTEPETTEYCVNASARDTTRIPTRSTNREPQTLMLLPQNAEGDADRVIISSAPTVIGRGAMTNPCSKPWVSRDAARVERLLDGRVRVTDLDSANGTYVNDVQVVQAYARCGDTLRVGPTSYVIHEAK
jgi:hypothetical protein